MYIVIPFQKAESLDLDEIVKKLSKIFCFDYLETLF